MKFDDVIENEDGSWVYLCEAHSKKFKGKLEECPVEGCYCSVVGCAKEAEYYGDL